MVVIWNINIRPLYENLCTISITLMEYCDHFKIISYSQSANFNIILINISFYLSYFSFRQNNIIIIIIIISIIYLTGFRLKRFPVNWMSEIRQSQRYVKFR